MLMMTVLFMFVLLPLRCYRDAYFVVSCVVTVSICTVVAGVATAGGVAVCGIYDVVVVTCAVVDKLVYRPCIYYTSVVVINSVSSDVVDVVVVVVVVVYVGVVNSCVL